MSGRRGGDGNSNYSSYIRDLRDEEGVGVMYKAGTSVAGGDVGELKECW